MDIKKFKDEKESQFKEWGSRVQVLEARAEKAPEHVDKQELENAIKNIQEKREALRQKLDRLETGSPEQAEGLKKDVEKDMEDFKKLVDSSIQMYTSLEPLEGEK